MVIKSSLCCLLLLLLPLKRVDAQTSAQQLAPILRERVQPSAIVEFELQHYLLGRVPSLPDPASAKDWTLEAAQFRRHLLNDIAFHGWPDKWLHTAPNFQDLGVIRS